MVSLTLARRSYVAFCVAMAAVYFALPAARTVTAALIGTASVVAMGFGVSRQRPPRASAWLLIATAVACFTVGAVIVINQVGRTTQTPEFPGAADACFLATYVFLALGLIDVGRPPEQSRDWLLILDVLALSVGGLLIVWVALIRPAVMSLNLGFSAKVVALASWAGYTAVIASAARVALVWRTNGALNTLVAGIAAFLVADYAYGQSMVDGSWHAILVIGGGYGLFVVLAGASALTPSMRSLCTEGHHLQRLGLGRLVLIAVALLVAPTVLLVEATPGPVTTGVAIGISGAAVGVIMVARLWMSAHRHKVRATREGAMSVATRALVEATTDTEVVASLQRALSDMLPARAEGSVHIGASGCTEAVLETAGAAGRLIVPITHSGPSRVQPMHPRPVTEVAYAAPIRDLTDLEANLTALADQAGAAFERIELVRQLRTEERERYFRTLVLTNTDATLITRNGRVDYATPSAVTIFGREMVGELFDQSVRRSEPGEPFDPRPWSAHEDAADGHVQRPDGQEVAVLVHRRDLRADPTVHGVVSTLRDVTAERQLQRDLAHRASHDALTGLSNARAFADELRREEAASQLDRRRGIHSGRAALFVDLDDFKNVNDTYGHQIGDLLLAEVARRITGCLREGDLAARLGGDEFAVLLRSVADEESARSVAQRVVDALAEPMMVGGISLDGKASVGLAFASRRNDLDRLIRNADTALYNAKARGKGRWSEFRQGMTNPTRHNVDARRQLQDALDDGQLDVHYQPVVDLRAGAAVGVEALVRPGGMSPPMTAEQIVAVGEETGLIARLGEFVLRRAMDDLARLPADLFVSVNVSARQLRQSDFADVVRQQLAASGAAAARLVLEVTESLPVDDERAWSHLGVLRASGVRIAIDDYGTGYASLSYLRQTALDVVKVDRSFTEDVGTERGRVLFAAILSLCADLNLEAVAEGVADDGAAAALLSIGCRYGQGFHFAPALPITEVVAWVAQRRSGVSRSGGSPRPVS